MKALDRKKLLLPTYNPAMDAIIANLNESLLADHVALPPPHSFDNKICLGQWTEARPPSLPRPSLSPAMKLLERPLLQEPGVGALAAGPWSRY